MVNSIQGVFYDSSVKFLVEESQQSTSGNG